MIIPLLLRTEPRKTNKTLAKHSKSCVWIENYFKVNADKWHLFLSLFSNANYTIASRNSEELLEAVIDSEVTFATYWEPLSED